MKNQVGFETLSNRCYLTYKLTPVSSVSLYITNRILSNRVAINCDSITITITNRKKNTSWGQCVLCHSYFGTNVNFQYSQT
jgi:hypothetical protein